MDYEWDEAKNLSNQRKHGVAFERAKEVFDGEEDPPEFFDGRYPPGEDRYRAIGPVGSTMLVVVFTEPADGVIRIISARNATRQEIELYIDYQDGKIAND